MATILRPPLVSQQQPKRPIAPVDYFSRPLTLGINPNARIGQLSDSAPQRTRRIYIDVYPNLLGTTLAAGAAATLDLPLRSGRIFDSAHTKRWQADPLQSQGLIVYDGPEAAVLSLTDSAPQKRRQLSIEQYTNLLSTTLAQAPLALPLAAEQLDESATPRKKAAYSFDFPNLLGTTLQGAQPQLALPLSATRLDLSAPAVKYQVRIEALSRPLTLGINPNAAVASITDSAPPPKRAAYGFDPPNLLVGTLLEPLALPLTAGRVDASAPILKYQVRVESLSRPVTLGVNPNAIVAQLSASAPPPKKASYPFDPPNLISTTLAEALDLPRVAVRMDWSAPTTKRSAYLDTPANRLLVEPPPVSSAFEAPVSRTFKIALQPRFIEIRR